MVNHSEICDGLCVEVGRRGTSHEQNEKGISLLGGTLLERQIAQGRKTEPSQTVTSAIALKTKILLEWWHWE